MSEPILANEKDTQMKFRRGRSIGIVGVLTVTVAVFGYVREASLAARFGVSATMDAYFGAIFIPNILYLVLITGMLSPIFIPILVQESIAKDHKRISETFSNVTNFVLLVLTVATLISVLLAHYWLPLLFAGFSAATTSMAVRLTYVIFPAVLFLAVSGICSAALNGFHRFALAAFAPALGSISVITAVFLARGEKAIYIVGLATATGFALQCIVLLPAVRATGIRYQPVLNLSHPAILKVLRLGIPLFLYLTVANASGFLERNLASHLSAGAVSTLSYALRLFMVPANFLVTPLATVVYPGLAREAVREGYGDLRKEMSRTLRLVFFFFFPTTIWVVLNALPVTRLLYERGQFHFQDSLLTSRVLAIYGTAILPYAATLMALRCFYAIEDTMTPLKAEVINLAYFIVLASWMTRHYGLVGLAVSRATSFFLVALMVLGVLARKLDFFRMSGKTAGFLLRTVFASAIMSAITWLSWQGLQPLFDTGHLAVRLGIVAAQLLVGAASFIGAALALKIDESRRIVQMVSGFAAGIASRMMPG